MSAGKTKKTYSKMPEFAVLFNVLSPLLKRKPHIPILLSYVLAALFLPGAEIAFSSLALAFIVPFALFYVASSFNYFWDQQEDRIGGKFNPFLRRPEEKEAMGVAVLFLLASALYLAYLSGSLPFALAMSAVLVAFLYSWHAVRLKRFKVLKPLSAAAFYFLIFLYVCSVAGGIGPASGQAALGGLSAKALSVGLFFAFLSFCGAVFRDVIDAGTDRKAGLRTLATDLSPRALSGLFLAATLLQFLALALCVRKEFLPESYLLMFLLLPLRLFFAVKAGSEEGRGKGAESSDRESAGRASIASYAFSAIIVGVAERLIG